MVEFVSYDGKNWVDTKDQFNASVLIKAFTSNTNEDIKVNTSLDKDKVSLYGSEQAILLTSKTQNISDTNLLEYEILDSNNNDVTNNFNISTSSNDSIHYANILVPNDYNLIVTPKEIDDLIENMKDIVAKGINQSL